MSKAQLKYLKKFKKQIILKSVGLFGQLASVNQLISQLIGISLVGIFVTITSFICLKSIQN